MEQENKVFNNKLEYATKKYGHIQIKELISALEVAADSGCSFVDITAKDEFDNYTYFEYFKFSPFKIVTVDDEDIKREKIRVLEENLKTMTDYSASLNRNILTKEAELINLKNS